MRIASLLLGLCALLASGCEKHIMLDYRPLGLAGMGSGSVEQLKSLNISEVELSQIVKLKTAGISDDTCVALVAAAHQHQHIFNSPDAVANLQGARYSELEILEIARNDKLDSISTEAVTLRLIGLSDSTVQMVLQRLLQGQATLSSAQISRLKNTGLTEKQVIERINQGMTDEQAETEITRRETLRNHANTGITRVHGRVAH